MQPDQITPRLISKREVAAYLGYSEKSLEKLIAQGIIPPPLPGTHRFDRRAIDAALDRASGIERGA